jgi:hypothetical protein
MDTGLRNRATTFEIITQGFARFVLPDGLTNAPVRDAARALTMNHRLGKGTSSRLTGWAIIREDGTACQADLAADGVSGGDPRTRYAAFADELAAFRVPVVFLQFTKSTVNIANVFATYDPRVTRICSPDHCETFDATAEPDGNAGVAHRNIFRNLKTIGIGGSDAV